MTDLLGKVAVVTGASRGAGRGIALVLGEAGATVYVTGRSARGMTPTEGLPGTVEETAERVTERGGTGIPVRCDHTVEADVEALFGCVRQEQGRLDLLVNNAWGGYERHTMGLPMAPFWTLPVAPYWAGMFEAGLRAHLLSSHHAVPLMLAQKGGLIVNTVAWAYERYLANLYYDVAKAAIIRMAFGMAQDLRPHGIAAVALAPGFMRTERVMAAHAAHPFDLGGTESPEYIGRAVLALLRDPDRLAKSGRMLTVGDLAREYGFSDIDGRQVPPFTLPEPGASPPGGGSR
jgi:NAD(P)-dependent dehydrogenase (short-subunit alcohol dehydrogenase family)